MKFNDSGNTAWVSFHGSWNSPNPVGYYVGYVLFEDGQPVEPSTSNTSLSVVLANQDNSKCPDNCFRPAGMKIDGMGRLFVASDTSGEIYVIQRTSAASNSTTNSTQSGGGTATSNGGSSSTSAGSAAVAGIDGTSIGVGLFGLLAIMFGMV